MLGGEPLLAMALGAIILPLLAVIRGENEEDGEPPSPSDPQIRWLQGMHDRESLYAIMKDDDRLTLGLEAAEALAQLGDVRGLDHLIAALRNPSPLLRDQAAQILQDFGHPRGLRALELAQEQAGAAEALPSATRLTPAELRARFEAYDTDDLVAIWHEHDGARWSDLAFDVIRDILTQRLGKPPPRIPEGAAAQRTAEDEIDVQVELGIQSMWMHGDVDGLMRIVEDDSNRKRQLEAAEALADLGNDRAVDVLIDALSDRDEDASRLAASLLDWLDLPRGNEALRLHGYEARTVPSSPEGVDEEVDARIRRLWQAGDTQALGDIMRGSSEWSLQMDAAEALAALGDEGALDFLIETLGDTDQDAVEIAADMLDWLDLPRGNQALREFGLTDQPSAEDVAAAEVEPRPPASSLPPPDPSVSGRTEHAWADFRRRQDAMAADHEARTAASRAPRPTPMDASLQRTNTHAGIPLSGAVGGVIAFLAFRLSLQLLGVLPLPSDVADWLGWRTALSIAGSLVLGLSAGPWAARIGALLTTVGGMESAEGDLTPVFVSLVAGAAAGLFLNALLYLLLYR